MEHRGPDARPPRRNLAEGFGHWPRRRPAPRRPRPCEGRAAAGRAGRADGGAVTGKGGQLSVSWAAPEDVNGAYVIDYDLRYFKGSSNPIRPGGLGRGGRARGASGIPDPGADDLGDHLGPGAEQRLPGAGARGRTPPARAPGRLGHAPRRRRRTTNAAPVVFRDLSTANSHGQILRGGHRTSTPSRGGPHNSPAGTLVSTVLSRTPEAAEFPADCSTTTGEVGRPIFHDADGDAADLHVLLRPCRPTSARSTIPETPPTRKLWPEPRQGRRPQVFQQGSSPQAATRTWSRPSRRSTSTAPPGA